MIPLLISQDDDVLLLLLPSLNSKVDFLAHIAFIVDQPSDVDSILLYFTVKLPINQPQGGLSVHLLLLPLIKPKMGWCCHCCHCSILRWALLLPLFNPKVGSAVATVQS